LSDYRRRAEESFVFDVPFWIVIPREARDLQLVEIVALDESTRSAKQQEWQRSFRNRTAADLEAARCLHS
jgi:hypothetical protein